MQPSAQSLLPVSFLYETCQDPEESKVAMELAALEEQVRGVVGAATHPAYKLTSRALLPPSSVAVWCGEICSPLCRDTERCQAR